MRVFFSSLVAAAAVTFCVAAHADSISFVSSAATTTTGSTLAASQNGTAAYQVNKAAAYPNAQPGSFYVSTNANGNQAAGTSYYTDVVNVGGGLVTAATVSFTADDYADIFVNGVQAYTHSSNSQYQNVYTTTLAASLFTSGINYITFANTNTGGPGAIDFAGTVTTVTPEPSSLMLLGTGILGVAGAARRRFLNA